MKRKILLPIIAILAVLVTGGSVFAAGYQPWLYRQESPPITVGEPIIITATGGFVNPNKNILPGEVVLSTNFEVQNKGSLQYGIVAVAVPQGPSDNLPSFQVNVSASGPGKAAPGQRYESWQPVPISAGQLLMINVEVRVAYDSIPGDVKVALELRRVAPSQPPTVGEKG